MSPLQRLVYSTSHKPGEFIILKKIHNQTLHMYYFILAIDPHIHVLWIPVVVILSMLAGMLFRQVQLKKARNQILSLENEMMNNHAEILRLQKKLTGEKGMPETRTPVVTLKEQPDEEKNNPDTTVPHQKRANN